MDVKDYLLRIMRFTADDFFREVIIQDETRARHPDTPTEIELPREHIEPYFKAGEHLNIHLEDITPERPRERRFCIDLLAKLSYRTNSEKIVTITLGSDMGRKYLKEELRKWDGVLNDRCGTYLLTLEIPVPDIFVHNTAYPQIPEPLG